MNLRHYQENDWKALFELYNSILTADRVSESFFLEHLILSPNFEPKNVLLAEENGTITGAVVVQLAIRNYSPYVDQVSTSAGTGFMMPPLIRNLETGKFLIAEAEKYLKSKLCRTVKVAAMGPTLFPDSVDAEAYPVLAQTLTACGYQSGGHYYSMRRDLHNFQPSGHVAEKIAELKAKGIEAKVCENADLPALYRYMKEEHSGWVLTMQKKLRQHEMDQIVIIRNKTDVLGYCQYNYYDEIDRVGPFGVAKSMRGQGAGQVMVAKLLETMAERGFLCAWFASCSEFNATHFYNKNGFTVYRTKELFSKNLEA